MWVLLLLVAIKLSSCIPAVLVAGLIEHAGDVDTFEGASHWAELLVAAFLTLGYNAVVRAPPSRASSLASVGLMFTAFALLVVFPTLPFATLLILFTAAWVRLRVRFASHHSRVPSQAALFFVMRVAVAWSGETASDCRARFLLSTWIQFCIRLDSRASSWSVPPVVAKLSSCSSSSGRHHVCAAASACSVAVAIYHDVCCDAALPLRHLVSLVFVAATLLTAALAHCSWLWRCRGLQWLESKEPLIEESPLLLSIPAARVCRCRWLWCLLLSRSSA